MTTELLLRHHDPDRDGLVHRVTPASAGWGHVGFELYRLKPGQTVEQETGEEEACLVLVGGRANVAAGGQSLQGLGERAGAVEGKRPRSGFVAWGDRVNGTAPKIGKAWGGGRG